MGTIIFRLWNEASLINCTAITEVTPLSKLLPKSPKETAGSHCEGLGGGEGATGRPPARARAFVRLFCS